MTEDAGKKKYIKDFLQQVKGGEGYIGDIWIERFIRPPGTDGKCSTAKSLSGRKISNLSELLDDDLKHCFDDGYFTFRFVAALLGSGKTYLLKYLYELINDKQTYRERSIVIYFELATLLNIGINQSFSIKLYSYILAKTFWGLVHNTNLSLEVKEVGEKILGELCSEDVKNRLTATKSEPNFINKFLAHFGDSKLSFEDVFFQIISEVSNVAPLFTFVYLIDELDALEKYPNHIQGTRSLFRALLKKALGQFNTRLRLLVYLGGTSNNLNNFIAEDSVIESHVRQLVITLYTYTSEYEKIREKIDKRIEGAYKGYKDFSKAWEEIQNITINRNNLRDFCKDYASSVLEIHEKYFKEAPEQVFEGNARELVETKCREKWKRYLKQCAYTLDVASTTTSIGGHAFDCYVELKHNGKCVARAFGEAKNYELFIGHFDDFSKWLEEKEVNFKPCNSKGNPPDLAFMIAPSCPYLLQRKLKIANIEFIQWDKILEDFQPNKTKSYNKVPHSSKQDNDVNDASKNIDKEPSVSINEESNADILIYLPKSSVQKAMEIIELINNETNQQIPFRELKKKYYPSDNGSLSNPIRDLKNYNLINSEGNLLKIKNSLQECNWIKIADYVSNILINHQVVITFYRKTQQGERMKRKDFEAMLTEVCYANKNIDITSVEDNTIRLITWLNFAGLIEHMKTSKEQHIYRPIGEGKNKGKLPPKQLKFDM